MSLKLGINDFNRVEANISIVQLLSNEPMNCVTFVSTIADYELKSWSGLVSKKELETDLGAGDLVEKAYISLGQSEATGRLIKPSEFFTCGLKISEIIGSSTPEEKTIFLQKLQEFIYEITVTSARQFTNIVFDDCLPFLGDPDFLLELDRLLSEWFCTAIFTVDKKDMITEKMVDECTNIYFVKAFESATDTFEKYSDGAFAGRIVYQGVGNTQGVAKELTGITAYKPSFIGNEEGKLSVTEAKDLRDAGLNIYTRYVNNKNETSGLVNLQGEDFTNVWALFKVTADLSQDLHQLRHNTEVLTTSHEDEGTVRAVIVDRMARLKRKKIDGGQEVIYDYLVKTIPLDYTLEQNQGRFEFNIEVSLFQEAKSFSLNITGYKDMRTFSIKEA